MAAGNRVRMYVKDIFHVSLLHFRTKIIKLLKYIILFTRKL